MPLWLSTSPKSVCEAEQLELKVLPKVCELLSYVQDCDQLQRLNLLARLEV
uniref:Uncharacterized protein n=1 Tax=Arion vulgaris TaxID=1028688 RepID=A0A0B6ZHF9_9EUPU